MGSRRWATLAAVVFASGIVAAGCGSGDGDSDGSPSDRGSGDQSIQLPGGGEIPGFPEGGQGAEAADAIRKAAKRQLKLISRRCRKAAKGVRPPEARKQALAACKAVGAGNVPGLP